MKTPRVTALAAAACIGTLALTSCGADAADGDETPQLRMAWWGADYRNSLTFEMIEICEAEADVRISPEHTDWEGYWDQLATQTAGGNAPDIMQMDDTYLREYADRDLLMDLSDVDLSAMDEDAIANGYTEEHGQVGVTTGINAMAVLANPEVFESLGRDLPDDTTWTWDDFHDLVVDMTEELGPGAYGDAGPVQPVSFQLWLRQQGLHLTTEEGELGFEPEDLAAYFEQELQLVLDGGYPSAELMQEEGNKLPGETMFEVGDQAMARYWSNQMTGVSEQSGVDMVPLRWPSTSGTSAENGLWFKSTMLWSGSANTAHPEAVQSFISCLVNNEEAGLVQGMDRGLPANENVREAVRAGLEGQDLIAAEFLEEIEDDVNAQVPEPVPATGSGGIQEVLRRYSEEVYFQRMTPIEAAEAAHQEADRHIGN